MLKKLNTVIPQKDYTNVVSMQKLFSNEMVIADEEFPRPVLYDINLEIMKGEVWGISGRSVLEIKLLLEIMANIKPYKDGKCILLERGMMRLKRIILPHVFYIGTSSMIYNNMNVLEFLMFATGHKTLDVIRQQERVFELLVDIGLGNISLTPVSTLTPEYKAIVLLLAAYYSASQLIVLNLPNLCFCEDHITPLIKISQMMQNEDKTLVFSSFDGRLIELISTHTAVLVNGTVAYSGEIGPFCKTYDRVVLVVCDKNTQSLLTTLREQFPGFDYSISTDNCLIIKDYNQEKPNLRLLYQKIAESGFAPERVLINHKNYENACEEITKRYDIQKQLF